MSQDGGTQQSRRKPARWETMARLEGRITQRQLARLQALRQRLTESKQRAKFDDAKIPAERITLNTLIRASLELLFLFDQDIEGHTEQEITAALKAAVQELRRHDQPDGE